MSEVIETANYTVDMHPNSIEVLGISEESISVPKRQSNFNLKVDQQVLSVVHASKSAPQLMYPIED